MGEGEVRRRGRILPARRALAAARIRPVTLAAKEGLALINGVQMSVAVGGLALRKALFLARAADLCGAATLDASRGSDAAFDPRVVGARPHPGAIVSARNLRSLLAGSAIRESHRGCGRVQDNYALRCMPQVHGAARDAFEHARSVLEREINSATDNPLVFPGRGDIVSGGNFHGAPVGLVLDYAAIAATDLASISERRIEKLMNPATSELPAFLVEKGGLNSGLMMAQITAAALVSECKALSHPASVDSIPTSAEQGGPRLDVADRGAQARADRREPRVGPGDRAPDGVPGDGVPAAAPVVASDRARPAAPSAGPFAPGREDRELHRDLARARAFLSEPAFAAAAAELR